MDKLRRAVESEFPVQDSHRRLLLQVDELLHRHASLIVDHSFLSLGGAVANASEHGITYDVGVSTRFIPQALFIAFFSYIHLTSLVVHGSAQESSRGCGTSIATHLPWREPPRVSHG